MAKIIYSMMGEGRGHATRSGTAIEALRRDHEIHIFTYGQALSLLRKRFGDTPNVTIEEIDGLRFAHKKDGRIDLGRTVSRGVRFFLTIRSAAQDLRERFEALDPDLAIVDFEPVSARAFKAMGLPFISFDHQHFMTAFDLSGLPKRLQRRAALMAKGVDFFVSDADRLIVSSFLQPPLRADMDPDLKAKTFPVGVMMRPEVLALQPSEGEHVLAYSRVPNAGGLIDMLKGLDVPVRLYGQGERGQQGNIEFCKVSETRFVSDLATCRAVIASAGNQLSGEAAYFGKPMFAIPEPGQFEQEINAYYVKHSFGGECSSLRDLEPAMLHEFLKRAACVPLRDEIRANEAALAAIEGFMAQLQPAGV